MTCNAMRRYLAPLVAVAVVVGLAGVAPHAADQKKPQGKRPAAKAPVANPVWPLPPEQPRIRYLRSFRSVEDFKMKKDSKWKSLLLGKDPAQRPPESLVKPYGVAVSKTGRVY